MDIAAASIGMNLNRVQSQASLDVFCKAKDYAKQSANNMIATMTPQLAPTPAVGSIGSLMDISA